METGQRRVRPGEQQLQVGEFVRACLESLALTYRKTIEGLEDILGRRIGVIHEDCRYDVVMRNISKSGALIEGLLEPSYG